MVFSESTDVYLSRQGNGVPFFAPYVLIKYCFQVVFRWAWRTSMIISPIHFGSVANSRALQSESWWSVVDAVATIIRRVLLNLRGFKARILGKTPQIFRGGPIEWRLTYLLAVHCRVQAEWVSHRNKFNLIIDNIYSKAENNQKQICQCKIIDFQLCNILVL